ncbi:MAG: Na+/H+ antiporter NhaC family protein [Myxococcota bacterium]
MLTRSLLILLGLLTLVPSAQAADATSLEVEWPARRVWVGAAGVEGVVVRALDANGEPAQLYGTLALTGMGAQGQLVFEGSTLALPPVHIEAATVTLRVGELESAVEVPILPGWLSLLPAVVAIALALVTRQVLLSLFGGIYLGALLLGSNPIRGFGVALDTLVRVAADEDHIKIMMFTLLMGGMVGVITRSGGTAGIVASLIRYAKTPRSASLASWGMGMLVFFDDYASSLLVGNTMRPITDDLKVSREKLAYIVDSTAAPISSLAIVSTWIGYEVSVLAESMAAAGIERDAYEVFISGLPSRFYQILSLGFVAMVAWMGRDFGPMLAAERRARRGEGVMREGAAPLMDANLLEDPTESGDAPPRAWLAWVPILSLIGVAFAVLWITGSNAAVTDPEGYRLAREGGFVRTFGFILGNSASYDALLYGAGSGVVSALVLAAAVRAVKLGPSFEALVKGIQAMMLAVLTLTLAWGIGSVMGALHAGPFVTGILSGAIPLWLLPSLAFILAALIAFATGTSWGTMAVLFPIVIPLVAASGGDPLFESVFLATASAILGGAVFGDHCSPISDTTVLSSIACASDHVDHTRTQAPYALFVGAVTVIFGYIPAGLGLSPWISILLGFAILWAVLKFVGRDPEAVLETAPVARATEAEA